MKIMMRVMFSAKLVERSQIDELVRSYGIRKLPSGPPPHIARQIEFVDYELEMSYDLATFQEMSDKLEQLGVRNIDRSYSFCFEDQDYEQTSLFLLSGLGNSPDAYLEDQGTEYEIEFLCDNCKLHRKTPLSPLVIDTSFLSERYMVFVEGEHLVVSQLMAERLEQWKMTGFRLEPVIHKGDEDERQPAYRLIPTHDLPAWSDQTPCLEIVGKRKCPVCNRRGYIHYPPHYNRSDLIGHVQDFNMTREYIVDGNRIRRLPIVSAALRERVIQHKITDDVRSNDDYGEFDWRFVPVIISEK